jgi:hypothetical protein
MAMAALLGGCVAPGLGLAGLAADGVSRALTGQSTAEQAWSLARAQSCRINSPTEAQVACGSDPARRIPARTTREARPPALSALAAVYRADHLPRAAAALGPGAARR